jgi:hypothetical protein
MTPSRISTHIEAIAMTRRILSCVLAVLALGSGAAHALLFRAYLDPNGNDANPCNLAAPCRLLPAALAAVADGGEIWMLDSGNYNTAPVNVAKSVTILAIPGALGSVVAISGDAIDITTPGIKVTLRNLVIVPFPNGTGAHGISINAASALNVEGCVIAGITSSGIVASGGATVRVRDSTIRNSSLYGLWVQNGATATVTRATLTGNGDSGVSVLSNVAGTTTVDIRDSTVGGGANGVKALSTGAGNIVKASVVGSRIVGSNFNAGSPANGVLAQGAGATASVSDSIVASNGLGISAITGGIVWSTNNTVSNNTTGLSNNASTFNTSGNNAVRNNGVDVVGAGTLVPMQ